MSEQHPKISVTLKGGGGYDAPWIVLYADSVGEMADAVNAVEATGLGASVGTAAAAYAGHVEAGKGLGAQPVQHPASYQPQQQAQAPAQAPQQAQQAPQAQQQQGGPQNGAQRQNGQPPPGVEPVNCQHGAMRYINGRYGPFWGCPRPKDAPDKCKIVNIRD